MSACTYRRAGEDGLCPHDAVPGSALCLWHNPAVCKTDAYVKELLQRADARGKGDLHGFQLAGLVWPQAGLPLRNLRGADLRDAFLDAADLGGADLADAVLRRTSLKGADLRSARLAGTDLSGCNLSGADLRDADLGGALLADTCLLGADLRGARFAGARIVSFRWNQLTRFAGVSGLDPNGARAGADETQVFLAPLLASDPHPSGVRSALADVDPALTKSRVFAPGTTVPALAAPAAPPAAAAAPAPAAALALEEPVTVAIAAGSGTKPATPSAARPAQSVPTTALGAPPRGTPSGTTSYPPSPNSSTALRPLPRPHGARGLLVATIAALVLATGGVGAGIYGWQVALQARAVAATASAALQAKPVPPDAARLALLEGERTASARQHEADLAELKRLQGSVHETEDRGANAKQEAAVSRAEAEQLRANLKASENEALRLQGVDDRCMVLAEQVKKAQALAADLARHGAKESRVAVILAQGVDRLQDENKTLAEQRDQRLLDYGNAAQAQNEVKRLHGELDAAIAERERLQQQNQQLTASLTGARADMERYLARITATHLQDYLGDNAHDPLLPLTPGAPVALSGDYLLTLRVDRGQTPGTVQAQVVVQRPPAATNPEVTIVLYDQDERPLRRIAYSFPHVDGGAPFVSGVTTIACDRFPSFARVLVAAGMDDVSAKK